MADGEHLSDFFPITGEIRLHYDKSNSQLVVSASIHLFPFKYLIDDIPDFALGSRCSLDRSENFLAPEIFDIYDHAGIRKAMRDCLDRRLKEFERAFILLIRDIIEGNMPEPPTFLYSLKKLEVCWDIPCVSPHFAIHNIAIPLKALLKANREIEQPPNDHARIITSGKWNGLSIQGTLRSDLGLIAYAKAENHVRLETRYASTEIKRVNGNVRLPVYGPVDDIFRIADLIADEEGNRWHAILDDVTEGDGTPHSRSFIRRCTLPVVEWTP